MYFYRDSFIMSFNLRELKTVVLCYVGCPVTNEACFTLTQLKCSNCKCMNKNSVARSSTQSDIVESYQK